MNKQEYYRYLMRQQKVDLALRTAEIIKANEKLEDSDYAGILIEQDIAFRGYAV
ncbi:hypothetical protein [Weissella muntiaci]|jgi:hypothetical protein|uniref:hypothetical protein n=1 Tax=Weissella muntiaci TaxID=2508881 RepID=UPI001651FCE6|nr:hypothetical protein [Weissella muntiaci]